MLKLVVLVALVGLVAAQTTPAGTLKLAHAKYVTNTKASFAAAEPLYKTQQPSTSATLSALPVS
jgi:hypothetical protein